MNKRWKSLLKFTLLSGVLSLSFTTLAYESPSKNTDTANQQNLQIESCHLDGIKSQVRCGTLQVPENWLLESDETTISINFAILPAIDNSKKKTPLMFLAGGPGQAAVELAAGLNKAFYEIRKSHDIILVDQRGTGKSHALKCEEIEAQDVYQMIPEDFTEQEVKDCLAQFTGDLSQYNSENAIRDFDAIRQALGHQQLNLFGGSYGTRAALVYMRMFPESLRSVVLDSVGPIEVPIGLFGKSSAQSFNLLLEHCQQEDACAEAYPNLAQEYQQVLSRLELSTVTLDIPHPRLGTKTSFAVSKSKFIGTLFQQLYSVPSRALVPLIIHQTYLENYAPLAGMIAVSEGGMGVYAGLLFNITCNEDFPRVSEQMYIDDANNNFGGDNSQQAFKKICPIWPQYRPSEDFYQSVTADIPTLILSGGLDPVTPPSNGEYSAKSLPNSHHIVVDNVAHIVATSTCGVLIVDEFLTTLTPKELDESCLEDVPTESFMTSLNGGLVKTEETEQGDKS